MEVKTTPNEEETTMLKATITHSSGRKEGSGKGLTTTAVDEALSDESYTLKDLRRDLRDLKATMKLYTVGGSK